MRTRQAFINALTSLLLQAVLAVSGLIVPKFFILVFGSAVNGLVSSISQFISYMSLVEAGVGAASTVALYKPLADGDTDRVNGILAATRNFYLRSGLIFAGLVAVLVAFYPMLVDSEIKDVGFIRVMVLVLSVNGIVDYFFLGKYRVLLMADQRGYVLYTIQIIGTVIMTVVCIVQLKMGASAIFVKSTTAAIYILRSLLAIIYCRVKYPNYRFNVAPAKDSLTQRRAALVHQIVGAVANNAAVILLTVMVKKDALAEVSVYSVYNLVAYSLSNLLNSLTSGLAPSFGQVIAQDEKETLRRSYGSYEMIMFIIIFVCYTCVAVLLHPFVYLYSQGFTDGVNYVRPELVLLFALSGILMAVRTPGLTVICAAGHYKETQTRAIIELVISLGFSLILTPIFGIVGVMTAMCLSYLYRSADVIIYTAKYFVEGTLKRSIGRIVRNTAVLGLSVFGGIMLLPQTTDSWLIWLISAVAIGLGSLVLILIVNWIFEPDEFKKIFELIKEIILPKKRKYCE